MCLNPPAMSFNALTKNTTYPKTPKKKMGKGAILFF
jgi:hypothetical protein